MASCTNPYIICDIFLCRAVHFLCKVKMLLYISLVPFVKRNVSYFHCSIIVSLYYTVAYYSEELVEDKDVAKPQIFEGNETEGRAQHLKKKKVRIYMHTYIHYVTKGAICPLLFYICKIFLLFWKIFSNCCLIGP